MSVMGALQLYYVTAHSAQGSARVERALPNGDEMNLPRLRPTRWCLAVLVFAISCQTAQSPIAPSLILPQPTRVVTDDAGVLSVEEVQTLEAKLQELRTARLAEAIIYIAPSLPPGAVMEEVTLCAVNAWGVGRRGINDGLAIFVFVTDRKIRIEVGFGLEAVITDAAAKAIIDDQIAPAFRAHKYGEGLVAAVDELHDLLKRPR